MNSEKEFKDNLKDKLNSKEFHFDEANWQQAREMIDASRTGEKKRPFFYFILSGVLLFVSVICFYIFKPTHEVATTVASDNQATTTPAGKNNDNTDAKILASNNIVSDNEIKNTAENKIADPENNLKTKATAIKNTKKENSTSEKTVKVNANKDQPAIFKESKKQRTTYFKTASTTASVIKKQEQEAEGKEEKEIPEISAVTKKQEPQISKPGDQDNANEKTNTEIKAEVLVNIIPAIKINTGPEEIIAIVLQLPKKDSLPKDIIREPVHFISFEAGATYLFGWKNPGNRDANGINPVIGLNYTNVIAKKISFSLGVHYTMVRNLSYSNFTVKNTRYNFGEESDVMVFTPSSLHYFMAPLRLSYAFDAKNSFGLGCNVGYLFNVNSNVEIYSQHAGQKSNSTTLRTSGYTQGFKTIDTQLSVFYRRNLAKDLWLHTEFMYGLTDIKDNAFFNSNVHERNVGLKVTLIYNLFKK